MRKELQISGLGNEGIEMGKLNNSKDRVPKNQRGRYTTRKPRSLAHERKRFFLDGEKQYGQNGLR